MALVVLSGLLLADVIPLFEKEGQGEIFRTSAADTCEQIPLVPPFVSKGEVIQLLHNRMLRAFWTRLRQ
jgi:hypothetical protein